MKAFDCLMCGACCYGEGGIFVEPGEVEPIAAFLGVTADTFVSDYCQEIRSRYSIKSGEDGYCLFYDEETKCGIHPVKPWVCTLWPFYSALLKEKENWEMAQDACPGINPKCTYEEFVMQSKV